jgi:hypothetical protein
MSKPLDLYDPEDLEEAQRILAREFAPWPAEPAIPREALTIQKLMDTYASVVGETQRFHPNQGPRWVGGQRTLTMGETVSRVDEAAMVLTSAYHAAPFLGEPLPCPLSAFGLPVRTSWLLGEIVFPVEPAMKPGPYYQRRIKRWHRRNPPYTVGNGEYLLIEDREIWCHPDDFEKLRQTIEQVRPADTASEPRPDQRIDMRIEVPHYGEQVRPADTEAK